MFYGYATLPARTASAAGARSPVRRLSSDRLNGMLLYTLLLLATSSLQYYNKLVLRVTIFITAIMLLLIYINNNALAQLQ